MANMRVHELAKELNITSKDITDMLSNSEKTYKSVSGLTDAEISSVRKKMRVFLILNLIFIRVDLTTVSI